MKVLLADILAKINGLPADFCEHVKVDPANKSLASVTSFSSGLAYPVYIGVHKDDPGNKSILSTTCGCAARTLCKHATAFYAVSKGLAPQIDSTTESTQEHAGDESDALRLATMAAIDTDLKAHEARVEILKEVERHARRNDE